MAFCSIHGIFRQETGVDPESLALAGGILYHRAHQRNSFSHSGEPSLCFPLPFFHLWISGPNLLSCFPGFLCLQLPPPPQASDFLSISFLPPHLRQELLPHLCTPSSPVLSPEIPSHAQLAHLRSPGPSLTNITMGSPRELVLWSSNWEFRQQLAMISPEPFFQPRLCSVLALLDPGQTQAWCPFFKLRMNWEWRMFWEMLLSTSTIEHGSL